MKITSATPVFALSVWLALTLSMAAGQLLAKRLGPSAPQCTPSIGDGKESAAGEPVAIVAGESVYERDLDDLVASQILPLRNQEYEIKNKALEELIRQGLVEAEAKKQGLSTDQLYANEVDSKIATPSDDEVTAFFLDLKSQMKTPPALEEIKLQLQANLKAIQTRQARQDYADYCELRPKSRFCLSSQGLKSPPTAGDCEATPRQ